MHLSTFIALVQFSHRGGTYTESFGKDFIDTITHTKQTKKLRNQNKLIKITQHIVRILSYIMINII